MRGYGEVSESKARELNGLVEEIVSAVEKLDSYMAQGLGQDLQARLDRLDKNDGDDLTTIKTLERIINEHGLVEFRGMLSMIVDRLESKSFEIALFGRLERSETESKLRQTDIAGIAERLRNAAGRFADARRISLDITHEIQDSSELALATAAARLIDNWRQGDGVSPTAFVRQTLVELGTSLASRVFGVLQDLAGELNETLRETADDLHFKDADEEEDLTNALKQMPLMDLGTWEIDVTPGFLLKLSKHMAAKRIEQRLREQIGASVSKACYNFGKMMDAWARRTLSEIQTRFDSHADAYRAHMDRLSGSKQASEAEEISIRRDLDRLRVDPCARPRVGDGEAGDVLSKSDELRSQTSN
jgi:hypothetical protein